ncbi:hypothetical protein [Streptomyces regalis]|uniref:JmjC domain-containing protein n=1 Tax=Streptomyces regalis TaxID=68262 RepID=A0A101JAM8_9ACTN|nr:hypothetical protein [Streptomyces regalis]KUL23265.1 hypothetical protein ADL12_40060 [Streptomyces regalis]
MTNSATTPEEFIERWRTPPNLRVNNVLTATGFTFPPALDVLDAIRQDEEVRFTILGDEDWSVRMDRTSAFRTAPIEEVATWTFRLVHFNLTRFYDGILSGFQEQVMIPWRTQLSSWGFTWQRCAPLLFISTDGASSTYHNDNSHGLVCQIEGTKTFHSYKDPDRYLTAEAAVVGETTAEEPPEHDPADRQSVRMEPGDLLWSHALTPHWVTTESPLAMSVTLSHGGLCHQGHFADRELALRAYWDRHPDEAWKLDLRNVRY